MTLVGCEKGFCLLNGAVPPSNERGGDGPAQAQFRDETTNFVDPVRLRLKCD